MKKIIMSICFAILASLPVLAQNAAPIQNKIEVYGYAEEEITPDIIYINISLKEYFADNNNKNRVGIDQLEKQLIDAVKKAGLKEEDLTINNVSSYTIYDKKKKDPGFLASKQYLLKVSNLNTLNNLFGSLDERGIQSTSISRYDYSKMTEIKNQLRIKAVQNAKQKATVLAEALDQKIGKAIEVNDNNTDAGDIQPQARMYMMKATADSMESASQDIDFKTTKIGYQLRIVFELF
ncbi:SIMPL domain-containing protein [Olivibacter sitiensis]|uniref:SIMPL domain-containing protein n=1 Tax=Olivibacter sitiensis TaxID=376470 RepID=UPI0003FAA292|nr:SIMPL domain-containing protein [Olivibacter sitiensis]